MSGFIYAIAADEAVKIGWSKNPGKRLSSIQTGNHRPCRLIGTKAGTKAQEAELHQMLSPFRIQHEWYRNVGPVAMFVAMLTPANEEDRVSRPHTLPGNALRLYRIRKGVSIFRFAEEIGCSHGQLGHVERGGYPGPELLKRIAVVTAGEISRMDQFGPRSRAA